MVIRVCSELVFILRGLLSLAARGAVVGFCGISIKNAIYRPGLAKASELDDDTSQERGRFAWAYKSRLLRYLFIASNRAMGASKLNLAPKKNIFDKGTQTMSLCLNSISNSNYFSPDTVG